MAKFRTSARSVDMLGRQQIAGIPTAVSELFKNSYDAYATVVRGDFFPDRRVLMLRDDGVGMTRKEFESRWLVVGTDSKVPGSHGPTERPADLPIRRQMGEKGIGRLAIASLAPQVLVCTRAARKGGEIEDEVTVALVQWTQFEIPGLTLEEVQVPIRTVASIAEVTDGLVTEMSAEIIEALLALDGRIPDHYRERIVAELSSATIDPRSFLRLNGPNLQRHAGTLFLMTAVTEDVDAAMSSDATGDEFTVSDFQRFMLGFTNTITPGEQNLQFTPEFIRHEAKGPRDVIDPSAYFWEASDFASTDHTIEGEFDARGTFSGKVSVYGREAIDVVEPWTGNQVGETACGPFRIKFGYVQGRASDSRLPGAEFQRMTARLESIGGLYVYRDGIRVLPYGNSDFDYLEIEKRRTLNAATYYFSYRRMFGAIELSSSVNPALQEKAGREGFRENRAYREFRDILKGFLIQLAASLFSAKSDDSETWRSERERLQRQSDARAKRERAEKQQRAAFVRDLERKTQYLESGGYRADLDREISSVESTLQLSDISDAPTMQSDAARRLQEIHNRLMVQRPPGLPLSRDEERDLTGYHKIQEAASVELRQAAGRVEQIFERLNEESQSSAKAHQLTKARSSRLAARGAEKRDEILELADLVSERAMLIASDLSSAARSHLLQFDHEVDSLVKDVEAATFLDELQLLGRLDDNASRHGQALRDLADRAEELARNQYVLYESVALKEEVLDLREQIDSNVELLQLGQAVQVVSHEFEASISAVRRGLQQLAPWARSTPRLQPIVRDLRASFAHLDGYLRLFTPLQRRLYRETVAMRGDAIEDFLRGVFGERLHRHGIDLKTTSAFQNWAPVGYPSTFYPVFVNLIDNAIYWVGQEVQSDKTIVLDADDTAAWVSDSGPGVRPRDREAIFERGFTRKRGGRGLGLSLARELLERDGWNLRVADAVAGTVFRIEPRVGTA